MNTKVRYVPLMNWLKYKWWHIRAPSGCLCVFGISMHTYTWSKCQVFNGTRSVSHPKLLLNKLRLHVNMVVCAGNKISLRSSVAIHSPKQTLTSVIKRDSSCMDNNSLDIEYYHHVEDHNGNKYLYFLCYPPQYLYIILCIFMFLLRNKSIQKDTSMHLKQHNIFTL